MTAIEDKDYCLWLHGETCYRRNVSINHYSWNYSVGWHTGNGVNGKETAGQHIRRPFPLHGEQRMMHTFNGMYQRHVYNDSVGHNHYWEHALGGDLFFSVLFRRRFVSLSAFICLCLSLSQINISMKEPTRLPMASALTVCGFSAIMLSPLYGENEPTW